MEPWLVAIVTSILSVGASSGFWAWLMKKDSTKSATSRLMMGLAYDKLTHMGMKYIERGWISKDEYEDYRNYLYDPYVELGGNGVAKKLMDEIAKLPMKGPLRYSEINHQNRKQQEVRSDRNQDRSVER